MGLNGPLAIVFNVVFFGVFLGFLTGVLFVPFRTPSSSGPDTLG